MIRGTTPTIIYKFPFEVASITQIRIYFTQGSTTVIVKDESDCTFEDDTVSVTLTEEETFKFSAKKRIDVNARFATQDVVGGTIHKYIDVYDTGSEEVLIVEDETDGADDSNPSDETNENDG